MFDVLPNLIDEDLSFLLVEILARATPKDDCIASPCRRNLVRGILGILRRQGIGRLSARRIRVVQWRARDDMEVDVRNDLGCSRPVVLDNIVVDLVVRDVRQCGLEHRAHDDGQDAPDLGALIAAQMPDFDAVFAWRDEYVPPCQRHDVQKRDDVCI